MHLREIGSIVRQKRIDLGLTQAQASRLANLSRTTINQLETGSLEDIGYTKLANLMNILGLDLNANSAKGLGAALETAARSVSTSYKKTLSPAKLGEILRSGAVPDEYQPHLMTLLDETPLPLVVKAMQEASRGSRVPPRNVVRNVTRLADQLHAYRKVW